MAKKTHKKRELHIELFYRLKWESLRRHPDYISGYKNIMKMGQRCCERSINPDEWKRRVQKSLRTERIFCNKWHILSAENPDDPRLWLTTKHRFVAKIIPNRDLGKELLQKYKNGIFKAFARQMKRTPHKGIKSVLKDNRYLTIEIDTHRDKEVIIHDVSKILEKIKSEKEKYNLGVPLDKSPHLDKFPRYFAVWDLVQQRQEVWPFNRIILKLKEDGWYKNQTIKQAENLARQDYRTACKLIGVPVKNNKLKKVLKPIIRQKVAGVMTKHNPLFIEWEERLNKEGLGLKEYSTMNYSPDSALRKKLSKDPETSTTTEQSMFEENEKEL